MPGRVRPSLQHVTVQTVFQHHTSPIINRNHHSTIGFTDRTENQRDIVLNPFPEKLEALGFEGVNSVRQGKFIEIELAETDEARAAEQVEEMCKKLLANTVIENYDYKLVS